MGTITDMRRERSAPAGRLCRYCGYHPASPRIVGYCSWDCYDQDDGDGGPEDAA